MSKKTQSQLIISSVGHQYMATYAGVMGDVKYYKCTDVAGGQSVGFVAAVAPGKFGPLCPNHVAAAMRARNIAECTVPWWTRLLSGRQK